MTDVHVCKQCGVEKKLSPDPKLSRDTTKKRRRSGFFDDQPEKKAAAITWLQQGASCATVARRLGVGRQVIRSLKKELKNSVAAPVAAAAPVAPVSIPEALGIDKDTEAFVKTKLTMCFGEIALELFRKKLQLA